MIMVENVDKNVGLLAPWTIYANQVKAMFKEDPEVKVIWDDVTKTIFMYVDSNEKADALEQLLPAEKEFGNIIVKITIVPANKLESDKISLFQKAFKGNKAVSQIITLDSPFGPQSFVVFEPKVVQYDSDDTRDLNGLTSTLYQNLAEELFGGFMNIHFCTEKM